MSSSLVDFEMPDTFHLEAPLRPPADTRAYRDAMATMGTTVCVVAARLGAERLGRTVTSLLSLSIEPPAVLVSIDMASSLADVIAKTRGFSFAILSDRQQAVADAFAGRGDPERRFDNGRWLSWKSGHPRLADAVASMDCEIIGAIETGSHVLFAGAVVDLEAVPDRTPLILHRRRYGTLLDPARSPGAASGTI